MIDITMTDDKERIKKIITADCVWDVIKDCELRKDKYEPNTTRFSYFILSDKNGDFGLYMFEKLNTKTLIIHPVILRKFRKKYAYESYRQIKKRVIDKILGITSLIVIIPEIYRNCILFASYFGFKKTGFLPNSCERNGKLINQLIMSKEQWAE